ncbi:GntR family transcriptional regulator [Ruegeria sp. 2205SS24-7]|uniref:GntR family transcriptional regulator n=1 Tax=Ruegeria discodermiae TaxID=3064389 RepID=UPI0027416461|nr:GntR family transcriptional regulator [Ruegeria sp. 2205SS24-7]MDP5218069.1 GntR family transcriptional regulator [Ruegeria sp. 2205SS24-7]
MTLIPDIDMTQLSAIAAQDGPLSQQVYQILKQAILSLDFPPGAVLRKPTICARLGVSRAPVSEAITRLSEDGLVEVIPQSATRVAYFSMPEIREGAFLREALEIAAVGKVAQDRTETQLTQLNRTLRLQALLAEDGDFQGFYEADEAFHAQIMQFTGFARLTDVAQKVSLQVTRARILLLPSPGRMSETLQEHRAVFEAIHAQDPQAAQTRLRHHLGQLMPRIAKLAEERPRLFRPLAQPGPPASTKRA